MQHPRTGDVVELAFGPNVSPKYLNGAHIEVKAVTPRGLDGVIVKTGPKQGSYKNRVGARVRGIQPEMIGHVFEAA